MTKGIIFGVLAQLAFSIGLTFINQADFDGNQHFLKSNLILILSGILSAAILSYLFITNQLDVTVINGKNCIWLFSGSIFLLVIGEYFFIKGASVSSVTNVSITALAFPIVALITEYIASKLLNQRMPVVELKHIIGFIFIAAGFIIYTND
ncbi:MAG: hypothetical protein ACXV8Q_08755 [Methylobacter sp.]